MKVIRKFKPRVVSREEIIKNYCQNCYGCDNKYQEDKCGMLKDFLALLEPTQPQVVSRSKVEVIIDGYYRGRLTLTQATNAIMAMLEPKKKGR